jgi:hypothetical protein
LIVPTGGLALNDKLLSVREQCQKDVDVDVGISQVTDVDRSRAGLRCIVPDDVAITGIAAGRCRIGTVQEQIG